jgi:hypothetical protein
MSLLNPKQIYEVLQQEKPRRAAAADQETLTDLLAQNGLTPNEILEQISHEMKTGDTATSRISAAKVGLQLNGLLDSDNTKPDFHVTINILDSEFSGMNPILLPR